MTNRFEATKKTLLPGNRTPDRVVQSNGVTHKVTLSGQWPAFTATLENGSTFSVDATDATIIPNTPTGGRLVQL